MLRVRARWLVAAVAGALGPAAASSGAGRPPSPCAPASASPGLFTADTNRAGVIDLFFVRAQGATVRFYECLGARSVELGERSVVTDGVLTAFYGATQWRCDRLVRRFAATVTLPDGTVERGSTSVRTTSCAHRFALMVPRRLKAGGSAEVRVLDRWGIGGVRTRLCLEAPDGRSSCRALRFPPAVSAERVRVRPAGLGVWGVSLRVGSSAVRASLAVGVAGPPPAPRPPTVLATGDSTMQGVDSFLADDLAGANVAADARPGSAISFADGWGAVAAAQVSRLRPAATVVSLGANEGFPMRVADGSVHACCDQAWVTEYTRRVRAAMEIYRRGGRGRVVWLTIAAPREPARIPITTSVDAAIVAAAVGLPGVAVLRADLLFSPHGYQPAIRWRGRDVAVREPDGVHLNVAGTAIEAQQAARVVARMLRH
jgi:lysophospholipase L1-like esterase